jgi:hypothetical protein
MSIINATGWEARFAPTHAGDASYHYGRPLAVWVEHNGVVEGMVQPLEGGRLERAESDSAFAGYSELEPTRLVAASPGWWCVFERGFRHGRREALDKPEWRHVVAWMIDELEWEVRAILAPNEDMLRHNLVEAQPGVNFIYDPERWREDTRSKPSNGHGKAPGINGEQWNAGAG